MLFRMIYEEKLAQAAYLIGCQRTGEALVIDPHRAVQTYLELVQREGMRLTAIAETHLHADFLSGARALAERTGARLYLSGAGDADWQYQWLNKKQGGGRYDCMLVRDGDSFRVGAIAIQAMHTPGHTPEHVCYLVTDLGAGATTPLGIATGDFVLVGDLGRPDLLETAAGQAGAKEQSTRQLYQSAQRFFTLPDYLQLWPGHGAGSACGKVMGAVPQSTVGYEKLYNPALLAARKSEAAFADEVLEGQLEPPLYFARMKQENRNGPALLHIWPEPAAWHAGELSRLSREEMVLLDTRPWSQYCRGHLPGALHVPLTNDFTTFAGGYVTPDQAVVLLAPAERVPELVADLVRIGLDRISGYLTPSAYAEYASAAGPPATLPEIGAVELQKLLRHGEVELLDVRSAFEFELGHLPGARNFAHTRLLAHLEELRRDRPVAVYCQKADRSPAAAALLARHGFQVLHLGGGLRTWIAAGGELTMD